MVDFKFSSGSSAGTGGVTTGATTINVGPTRTYTTPASAFALLDSVYYRGGITFVLDPGVYASASISSKYPDKVTVLGDTSRSLAGNHWKNGLDNSYYPPSYAGTGTITITNTGNKIVVSCATTDPDFVAGGIVSGDKVVAKNTAGTVAEYEIDSISGVGNNELVLTTTAPSMTGDTGFFIAPNVEIAGLSIQGPREVDVQGIYTKNGHFSVNYADTFNFERLCAYNGPSTRFFACRYNKYVYGGYLSVAGRVASDIQYCDNVYMWDILCLDDEPVAWPVIKLLYNRYCNLDWIDIIGKTGSGKVGFQCEYADYLLLNYGVRSKNIGYHMFLQGVRNAYTINNDLDTGLYGIWSVWSKLYADVPQSIKNNTTYGVRAENKALVDVIGGTFSGNGSDFSPAISGAEGNNDAIINHP